MKRAYPFPPVIVPVAIAAVALVAGLVLPWWKFGSASISVFDAGLFPVAVLVPALGLLALLDEFADVVLGLSQPARIGSFTRQQLRLVAAVDAAALAAAWFFMGQAEIGLGYWVSLAGSVAVVIVVLLPGRLEVMRQGLGTSRAASVATAGPATAYTPVGVPAAPWTAAAPAPQPAIAAAVPAAVPAPAPTVPVAPVAAPVAAAAPAPVAAAAPTSSAPASADFPPRWFCVREAQPLLDPNDPSRQVATLAPQTWYQAGRRHGTWLLAKGPGDVVGWAAFN